MGIFSLVKGIAIGAGAAYLFDPVAGRRRRSLIEDQLASLVHDAQDFVDRAKRDLNNRTYGLAAEAKSRFTEGTIPDGRLEQRVRATMGKYVSHPRAIEIDVHDGCVTLSGPILAEEVPAFLAAIRSVRGVRDVENQLDVHQQADLPSLQGGSTLAKDRSQGGLPPGYQLVIGTVASGFVLRGLLRRSPLDMLLGIMGCGICCQSASAYSVASSMASRLSGQMQGRGDSDGNQAGGQSSGNQSTRSPIADDSLGTEF